MSDRRRRRSSGKGRRCAIGLRMLAIFAVAAAAIVTIQIGRATILRSDALTSGSPGAASGGTSPGKSVLAGLPSPTATHSAKRARHSMPPRVRRKNPPPNSSPSSAPSTPTCSSLPSLCGYPGEASTGVPGSVKLLAVPGQVSSGRGWHYDSRGWVEVTGNHAVRQQKPL